MNLAGRGVQDVGVDARHEEHTGASDPKIKQTSTLGAARAEDHAHINTVDASSKLHTASGLLPK